MVPHLRRFAPFAALAVLVAPVRAAAQAGEPTQDLTELDLEQLMQIEVQEVYGASRRAQSTFDAPSSVTIVTRAEIRAHGYRNLFEVLRGVLGFHVTDDRNYTFVGVRGILVSGDYNSRVLCMVDGHRVNDPLYGAMGLGFESLVDIANVERVEIIRGPGSALYGSNAVFAVVNLVTGAPEAPNGEVELGDHETYLARAAVGAHESDDAYWWLSARGYTTGGEDLFYDEFAGTPSGGWTRGTDYEHVAQAQARWHSGAWSLASAFVWREKGIPTGSYDTVFDDSDNATIDAQGFVDLAWSGELGAGRNLSAHVGYDDYRYEGTYIYDDTANGGPPDLAMSDRGVGRALSAEAQYACNGAWNDLVTLGGELRWSFDLDQRSSDPLYGTYVDSRQSAFDWGVFLQDEVALGAATQLIAGVRFDDLETSGANVSPRLALVHHLREHTALKLLYGEAFRAPNAYELYYEDGESQIANPDIDPEHIATLEALVESRLGDSWHVQSSYFHYELDDLIAQTIDVPSGLLVFDNLGELHADGVELELEKRFYGGAHARLSQSLQRVEDAATGDGVANSPRHLTQLQLEFPLRGDALRAGLEFVYVGARDTLAGDEVDPYLLTNLKLRSLALADGVELSLRAFNLFDVAYSDPVGAELVQDSLQQDGRRLTLGLRISR